MRAPGIGVVTLALLVSACGESSGVSLPQDAARPLRSAVVAAPARAPAPAPAPAPAASADGPNVEAAGAQFESGAAPIQDPEVARVRAADVAKTLRPHFAGGTLAHPAYQAKFGPSAETGAPTAVAFVRHARPDRFSGFAVSAGRPFPFPALHGDGVVPHDIAAVMFRDIDDDPDRELVVLARYSSPDDPMDTFFDNVVLDWDAERGAFVRLPAVEGEIEAFENATAVLRHLRSVPELTPAP